MKAEYRFKGTLDSFIASIEFHAHSNSDFCYHYHVETPQSVDIWPADQGEWPFETIGRSIKLSLLTRAPEPGVWSSGEPMYDRLVVWCEDVEWSRLAPLWSGLVATLMKWQLLSDDSSVVASDSDGLARSPQSDHEHVENYSHRAVSESQTTRSGPVNAQELLQEFTFDADASTVLRHFMGKSDNEVLNPYEDTRLIDVSSSRFHLRCVLSWSTARKVRYVIVFSHTYLCSGSQFCWFEDVGSRMAYVEDIAEIAITQSETGKCTASFYVDTEVRHWSHRDDGGLRGRLGIDFLAEIWNVLIEDWLSQASIGTADQSAKPDGAGQRDASAPDRPWEEVPDIGDNRRILELWCEGYTAKEIGHRLGKCAKTVSNKISDLRRTFGDHVVPRRRGVRSDSVKNPPDESV